VIRFHGQDFAHFYPQFGDILWMCRQVV